MTRLAMWGGIECSINRVGHRWFSQLQASGHDRRIEDMELIASLGLRTVRYPVLWEMTEPGTPLEFDYRFADARLAELRRLRIDPIVGLLHHGSGPRHTSLEDPAFPALFAQYAHRIAARFPWVTHYTPINEPLTTARFSGLYGFWFPHRRDDRSFVRMILNQCRATVLGMSAIRRVNPSARLVQTEDLGTTHSTPRLAYQRCFDNERRWLTWDLLTGRVDAVHPLRSFLREHGASDRELMWFAENACPPQIVGINHYVTSDRYLDHRLRNYPRLSAGSNSVEPYIDTEAVRVLDGPYSGWNVIGEAWRRYGIPIALTEVHLGCSVDERVRWLNDARQAALEACAHGCDVRAMTAWALFGSFHWDRLLRDQNGSYEAGVFDVMGAKPRHTPLAEAVSYYSRYAEGRFATDGVGWWQGTAREGRNSQAV